MADIKEIKTLLSQLSVSVEQNHQTLSEKIDSIDSRINEVNDSITTEIKNLEERTFKEIRDLQDAQHGLQRAIAFNKDSADDSFGVLREEIKTQQDVIEKKSNELTDALSKLDLQRERIMDLERACHTGQQHNRGWNVEIDGIPTNVGDDPVQLEMAVIHICNQINVGVNRYDIDAVHRLPSKTSPKPTIVRFTTRKIVRDLHDNKKLLRNLADLDLGIPGLNPDSQIFIRASQSPYVKNLAYNCRQLKRKNQIAQVITGKDGRLTIKTLDGDFIKVGHENDLRNRFPDFADFKFDLVGDVQID